MANKWNNNIQPWSAADIRTRCSSAEELLPNHCLCCYAILRYDIRYLRRTPVAGHYDTCSSSGCTFVFLRGHRRRWVELTTALLESVSNTTPWNTSRSTVGAPPLIVYIYQKIKKRQLWDRGFCRNSSFCKLRGVLRSRVLRVLRLTKSDKI